MTFWRSSQTSQILDQSFQASKDFTSTSRVGIVAGGIDENGGGLLGESTSNNKLESILEHIVSYRDVPIMKELLTTQKKVSISIKFQISILTYNNYKLN